MNNARLSLLNQYLEQVMYILNSQAKGGLMAEQEAFDDERQALENWTRTDTITWVKNGALTGGKIQPKPSAQFPNGFFQLFNESREAITHVTGLSAEFIGTREVNQANVLENTRRQSTLNLLAGLFDNLKLYRCRQGKIIFRNLNNTRRIKMGSSSSHSGSHSSSWFHSDNCDVGGYAHDTGTGALAGGVIGGLVGAGAGFLVGGPLGEGRRICRRRVKGRSSRRTLVWCT